MERYPLIAVQGAMRHGLLGQPAGPERWTAAAERAAASAGPAERGIVEVLLAVLHAMLCRDGIERMRADAQFARERVEPGSTLGGPALHLEGASYLLAGRAEVAAARVLARSVEVATRDREMNAASYALAQRAQVAIQRHDWDAAGTFAEQALTVVEDGQLGDYVTSPLVYAVAARTALRRGDVAAAKAQLARAAPLRPLLTYVFPTYAVPALLELARAYFTLDDVAGPERPSGRPATSCACDPTSAPWPPRSRSCGRDSTVSRGRFPGPRH